MSSSRLRSLFPLKLSSANSDRKVSEPSWALKNIPLMDDMALLLRLIRITDGLIAGTSRSALSPRSTVVKRVQPNKLGTVQSWLFGPSKEDRYFEHCKMTSAKKSSIWLFLKLRVCKLGTSVDFGSLESLLLDTLRRIKQGSFGNNQIEDLSADVILQCSKSLSFWEGPNNQLRTVPSLFGCTRLTTVDLGDKALREAPAISLSIIQINLNNNAISSISGIFLGAQLGSDTFRSELAELSLRGNKLRNLEEDITRELTNVTILSCR